MTRFHLHHGDSRKVLGTLAGNSFDSIVCDPPYELGFMGKRWDNTGVANDPKLWAECLRVAKPGAYLVAFGGTRTFHRMTCAIEDGGWEIRDTTLRGHMPQAEDCPWLMAWAYGSGFPKSHNGEWGGTALKPAWEPIVCARKPLIGTVEANWREHGTGALNIDACRVAIDAEADAGQLRTMNRSQRESGDGWGMSTVAGDAPPVVRPEGRWPANLIHDGSDEVLAAFPFSASGTGAVKRASSSDEAGNTGAAFGAGSRPAGTPMICHGDEGSAARFFYCAKATQEDREEGLAAMEAKAREARYGTVQDGRPHTPDGYEYSRAPRKNHHPTVKPTDLMRWLVRLVTPKGGLVLDPFMGSGSTGKAAMLEGLRFTGIDLTAEYVDIARARIEFALRQGHQPSLLEVA